jgi:hypothetical protein
LLRIKVGFARGTRRIAGKLKKARKRFVRQGGAEKQLILLG